MAHWDDSGTAVGYEGKRGDKLIREALCGKTQKKKVKKMARPVKRGVGKKIPKAAKVSPRPVKKKVEAIAEELILDEGEDLDRLNNIFGVTDVDDIEDIVSGSVGEDAY